MPQLPPRLKRHVKHFVASRFSRDWFLIPLAALIGACGGVIATAFDFLVEHSIEFFFSLSNRGGVPSLELLMLVLLPAVGGLLVGVVNRLTGAAPRDHGIPTIVESLARKNGHISTRAAATKSVTASLTIGSGGSAGVEAPIILIGSALGSGCGRLLRVGREHMPTLVGCGAAAGIAAIFNAPIAGVIFVLEVILRDFSLKTFIPIVVASVFGTAVAQAILGDNESIFNVHAAVSSGYLFQFREIGHYAVLGVLCGLLGVSFTLLMRGGERFWDRVPAPRWVKPGLGGALLGGLGIVFVLSFPQPAVTGDPSPTFFGNGYRVIEALLAPASYPTPPAPGSTPAPGNAPQSAPKPKAEASPSGGRAEASDQSSSAPTSTDASEGASEHASEDTSEGGGGGEEKGARVRHATLALLGATLLFKLVGTMLTQTSGGSGGVIAPSLLMGATLGGAFAMACQQVGFFPGSTPATYALAGMAGVIAAVVHCPLAAFLLVFEITADYQVILPVMLVSITATVVAQVIYGDSIYGAWMRDMGLRTGTHSDLTLLRRLTCHDVPLSPAVIVQPDEPAQRLLELAEHYAVVDYVVADGGGGYLGMVVGQDVRAALVRRDAIPLMIVSDLMRTDLPTVSPQQTLDVVLEEFSRHDVSSLVVSDGDGRVKGVVTRSRLMRLYHQKLAEKA